MVQIQSHCRNRVVAERMTRLDGIRKKNIRGAASSTFHVHETRSESPDWGGLKGSRGETVNFWKGCLGWKWQPEGLEEEQRGFVNVVEVDMRLDGLREEDAMDRR